MAMNPEEKKAAGPEQEEQPNKKDGGPNQQNQPDKKENDDDEYEYWPPSGQLKLHCGDCDGILESGFYARLGQTLYSGQGFPTSMICTGPDCDTILEKRMLCFYCPHGSKHHRKIWCRFCGYRKALLLHKRRCLKMKIPADKAHFDKSVVIYGFGSISLLQ